LGASLQNVINMTGKRYGKEYEEIILKYLSKNNLKSTSKIYMYITGRNKVTNIEAVKNILLRMNKAGFVKCYKIPNRKHNSCHVMLWYKV